MSSTLPDTADIESNVRGYITSSLVRGPDAESLRNDQDLLLILNSLQLLRMVIEIESRFDISIDNSELTPENLGTVQNIALFIARKRV